MNICRKLDTDENQEKKIIYFFFSSWNTIIATLRYDSLYRTCDWLYNIQFSLNLIQGINGITYMYNFCVYQCCSSCPF